MRIGQDWGTGGEMVIGLPSMAADYVEPSTKMCNMCKGTKKSSLPDKSK